MELIIVFWAIFRLLYIVHDSSLRCFTCLPNCQAVNAISFFVGHEWMLIPPLPFSPYFFFHHCCFHHLLTQHRELGRWHCVLWAHVTSWFLFGAGVPDGGPFLWFTTHESYITLFFHVSRSSIQCGDFFFMTKKMMAIFLMLSSWWKSLQGHDFHHLYMNICYQEGQWIFLFDHLQWIY